MTSLARTTILASAAQCAAVSSRIAMLDLEPIKWKLVADPDGPQWKREVAEQTEPHYRQFLTLCSLYPQQMIVPSKTIDQFWHAHILDTMKYEMDCKAGVGFFLHHYPYFGARSTDDRAALEQAFDETAKLWQRHFGDSCADYARCMKPADPAYVKSPAALCGPANCDPTAIGERPRLPARAA